MAGLNSIILQDSNPSHQVGKWIFQMKDDPREIIDKRNWFDILSELNDFLLLINNSFSIQTNICILSFGEVFTGYETMYSKLFSPDNQQFAKDIELFLETLDKKEAIDFNYKFSVKLMLSGNLMILDKPIFFNDLFTIKMERSSSIALIISTNNFAFLPNNPLMKQRHYDIWKENAPKLAYCLREFSNKTKKIHLISEPGDYVEYGSLSHDPFYLSNNAIVGVDDPDFDEFYIPFNLIKTP